MELNADHIMASLLIIGGVIGTMIVFIYKEIQCRREYEFKMTRLVYEIKEREREIHHQLISVPSVFNDSKTSIGEGSTVSFGSGSTTGLTASTVSVSNYTPIDSSGIEDTEDDELENSQDERVEDRILRKPRVTCTVCRVPTDSGIVKNKQAICRYCAGNDQDSSESFRVGRKIMDVSLVIRSLVGWEWVTCHDEQCLDIHGLRSSDVVIKSFTRLGDGEAVLIIGPEVQGIYSYNQASLTLDPHPCVYKKGDWVDLIGRYHSTEYVFNGVYWHNREGNGCDCYTHMSGNIDGICARCRQHLLEHKI